MSNIGLDLDGVLYDWHRSAYVELSMHYGLEQTFEEFWTTGWSVYPESFWCNFVKIPFLYSNMVPSKSQLEMLNRLSKEHNLFYITNRTEDVKLETEIFLDKYEYPFRENLYFVDRKDLITIQFNLKYFVEDKVKNILDLSKVTNVIVMKQLWNQELWGKYAEINNILELEDLINGKTLQ